MSSISYKVWGIVLVCLSILGLLSYFYLVLNDLWQYAVMIASTLFVILFFGLIGWLGVTILKIKWPTEQKGKT
jgi:ABC-type transport system involved in multi-copper enzyme maturation permease subunit